MHGPLLTGMELTLLLFELNSNSNGTKHQLPRCDKLSTHLHPKVQDKQNQEQNKNEPTHQKKKKKKIRRTRFMNK